VCTYTVEPLCKGHAWDIKNCLCIEVGCVQRLFSIVIIIFHSIIIVVESRVAFRSPFAERFDCKAKSSKFELDQTNGIHRHYIIFMVELVYNRYYTSFKIRTKATRRVRCTVLHCTQHQASCSQLALFAHAQFHHVECLLLSYTHVWQQLLKGGEAEDLVSSPRFVQHV